LTLGGERISFIIFLLECYYSRQVAQAPAYCVGEVTIT